MPFLQNRLAVSHSSSTKTFERSSAIVLLATESLTTTRSCLKRKKPTSLLSQMMENPSTEDQPMEAVVFLNAERVLCAMWTGYERLKVSWHTITSKSNSSHFSNNLPRVDKPLARKILRLTLPSFEVMKRRLNRPALGPHREATRTMITMEGTSRAGTRLMIYSFQSLTLMKQALRDNCADAKGYICTCEVTNGRECGSVCAVETMPSI